jgi:hypothetical protein
LDIRIEEKLREAFKTAYKVEKEGLKTYLKYVK